MGYGVLQPWHLILIVVIILVVFGPGKLPTLGKAFGDSVRDFKKAMGDDSSKSTAVAELATVARECPNCHKTLAAQDRFCGECGARVSSS